MTGDQAREDEAREALAQVVADWHSGTPASAVNDTDRREAAAVIEALRTTPALAAAALGIDPDDWSAPSGLHTVRCGYDQIEFGAPCTCRLAMPKSDTPTSAVLGP